MAFNQVLQISEQDLRTVQPQTQVSGATFTPSIKYGQPGATADGRGYIFGLNNITNGAIAGNLQTAPATVANHVGRTLTTAQAIGSTTVLVPVGATAVTQSQYAQGYLSVISSTGIGTYYKILDNTSAVSSGTTTVTLQDPLSVALTTSSVVSLYPHPENLFAITTTTVANNNYLGVPNVAIPASNYGWLQTNGYCAVLADSSPPTKNTQGVGSAATAGSVTIQGSTAVTQTIGYAPETMVSAQTQLFVLQIV